LEDIQNTEDQEILRKFEEFPKEKVGNKDWLVPIVVLLETIYFDFHDKSILDIGGGHYAKGEKSSFYPIPEVIQKEEKGKLKEWLRTIWKPEEDPKEAPTLATYLSLKEAKITLLDPEANTDIPFWQTIKKSISDKNIKFKDNFDIVISTNFYPQPSIFASQERNYRKTLERAYELTKTGGITICDGKDEFVKNVLNDKNFLIKTGFRIIKIIEHKGYKVALLSKLPHIEKLQQ